MGYDKTSEWKDINGTSNVSYLLDAEVLSWVTSNVTPGFMSKHFGAGCGEHSEPSRGYDAPEWYFKCDDGHVLGIGFRWRRPRLRGKRTLRGSADEPWPQHPERTAANEFIAFIRSKVEGGEA